MNRREFVKNSSVGVAVLCTGSMVTMTACSTNIKALLNTVITAVQAILKVAVNSPWAAQLANALTALQNAEAQWTAGSTVQIVIDALNTLEAVCAVIPLTAVYSPLIDVLVTGIEAVLAVLVPTPAIKALRAKLANNPHHGRVALRHPHFLQTQQGAFRDQWNDTAKGLGLNAAKI